MYVLSLALNLKPLTKEERCNDIAAEPYDEKFDLVLHALANLYVLESAKRKLSVRVHKAAGNIHAVKCGEKVVHYAVNKARNIVVLPTAVNDADQNGTVSECK